MYASDKYWRITTRTRREKCGWFSLVSLTRPLFCDSISFPDGRDPEPMAVIRGGRVRKNRGWYRFDPGSAGPCMARARQLAKKERKKERKESSTRVWLGLRLLATQTARWPTAAFLRCNRPEQNIRRHFRHYPTLRSLLFILIESRK